MFECTSLALYERFESKQGLSSLLYLKCCTNIFHNSSLQQTYRGFKINQKIVYTMWSLVGHGYAGIQKFNTLMNIPKRVTVKTITKKFKKW